ncbi:flagellar biosynthesis protein FlhB [Salipiger sp. IMCC34102]|uniref:EscU/YscU/HrcU family type III secretion system export apparatus switch protein n=1 Tax=Salipiger sp. IMCC34102 TaxID=2510647 RepID=UPI00101BD0AA|nr:flagellar type III secretion system protein FlhB [Salipiger sp. IMCC34102]RYH01563.1 flagellar biosynthesis protein FlhB [Salipiger sp. IMCC34102]
MSEEDQSDKQHEASQKKLDDARKKGEIAKSNDLITAASYAGLLLALVALGSGPFLSAATSLRGLLDHADRLSALALDGGVQPVMGGILLPVAGAMAAWFTLPAGLALLCILAQRAFVLAPTKIAPKLSRISPITGAKNKFGRQGLFEFAKSFAKLMLYSTVLGVYLLSQKDRIVASTTLSAGQVVVELGRMMTTLLGIVLCIAAALGIVDYLFQHAEHQRKNRMSRKEMTDEAKSSEGDPAMKQRRRQKGIDLAMNQMLQDVPEASVIVVNPTHYAVALKWAAAAGTAPVCVAKGTDEIAARIREVATEHAIPIHSDPPTARALFATTEIGQEIAPDHYRAVAAAIRFADDMRRRMRGRR